MVRLRPIFSIFAVLIACIATAAVAQEPAALPVGVPEAGIQEKLGEYIPLDIVFFDEKGDSVRLGSLVDRPTIITPVYYTCPSVCRPLLNEVSDMLVKLGDLNTRPGEDYRVLTVSFDERDDPEGSAKLKKEYMAQLPEGFPEEAWTFVTGDEGAIQEFTRSIGFYFKRSGDGFAHPSTLVMVSPRGKITRYLYGAEYLPLDLKMALYEASEGRVGPTIARMLKFCFNYDPDGRKYVLNLTRIVGTVMILSLAGFALFLTAAGRRRAKEAGQ